MNRAERALKRLDPVQQRFRPTAFLVGLIRKFNDDNGNVLVANLTYSAFISIFPLLLVLATVLGLVAAVNPAFRTDAIDAVADQVPLIGTQLTENVKTLQESSVIGLIIGLVTLFWGTTRLARAGLFTMSQVWNVPGPARPDFVRRMGRSALFLVLLGVVVIATTLLTGLSTYSHTWLALVLLAEVATATVNAGMYFVGFRILTPRGVPSEDLAPGAIVAGILWTVVQVTGAYLVHHFLHSDSVYGVFATVLGLVAWIYLAARITVFCAEINVVVCRRLWPRSLIYPPLTEADRASMALQALQNQRRVEQQVTVTFNDRGAGVPAPPSTPQTPDEIAPPARRRTRRHWVSGRRAPDPRVVPPPRPPGDIPADPAGDIPADPAVDVSEQHAAGLPEH